MRYDDAFGPPFGQEVKREVISGDGATDFSHVRCIPMHCCIR